MYENKKVQLHDNHADVYILENTWKPEGTEWCTHKYIGMNPLKAGTFHLYICFIFWSTSVLDVRILFNVVRFTCWLETGLSDRKYRSR